MSVSRDELVAMLAERAILYCAFCWFVGGQTTLDHVLSTLALGLFMLRVYLSIRRNST